MGARKGTFRPPDRLAAKTARFGPDRRHDACAFKNFQFGQSRPTNIGDDPMTTTTTRLSAREVAAKFLGLKTNTSKAAKALIDDARSRTEGKSASKKARWERLAVAMETNDRDAVSRYADFAAYSAKQKAERAGAKAKAGARAKSAKAKAAPKAAPKTGAKPAVDELPAMLRGVDPDLLVAFLELASASE